MYIHVHIIYIYTYVYRYTCMYIYIYIFIYLQNHIHLFLYLSIYLSMIRQDVASIKDPSQLARKETGLAPSMFVPCIACACPA